MRSWATRLLFILTRCSRLVATEESSPFGGGSGGGPAGSAYMTMQPRSKGPGRLRRFSGFPMLHNQLSLDPLAAAGAHMAGIHAVSPRGGASPLLRSATAPSRSFKELTAGMHGLRIHDTGGKRLAGAAGSGTQLSPMPESPSTVRSPAASEMSTPSHPVRVVGLSPLGRSVVTALEAELEQAARLDGGVSAEWMPQRQQHEGLQGPAPTPPPATGGSGGTDSPIGSESPSKRQGIFKLLKLRIQSLRSASKEPQPAESVAEEDGSHHSLQDGLQQPSFALTPRVS